MPRPASNSERYAPMNPRRLFGLTVHCKGYHILYDVRHAKGLALVLDTSVVAAAFRSRRGSSNALLAAAVDGRVRLRATTALFLEYEAVLKRPEQRLSTGLDLASTERALASLASVCEPVDVHFRWRPQLRDPADEMVLEAALNGRVDALVTFNTRDFAEAGERFDLAILRPADVLRSVRP